MSETLALVDTSVWYQVATIYVKSTKAFDRYVDAVDYYTSLREPAVLWEFKDADSEGVILFQK